MTSITDGPSPDKLTTLDKLIDGQIGGLNTALENVPDTTRAVPLFEFRNLAGINAGAMESTVDKAEQEIIKYLSKYETPPGRRMARKRDDNDQYGCPTTAAPAMPSCTLQKDDPDQGINNPGCICGSTTLPLLTVASATDMDQSCSYTAMPTTTGANPITIPTQTYTSNGQACTIVGGIADAPTCTSVNGCTPTPTATATPTSTPPPPPPPPVCEAGFYGTDTSCGGKCNGEKANCQCIEAGYLAFNNACTCTC